MQEQVSAAVVLRPAGGGTHEGVTAATAEQSLPDPALASRAEAFFRQAGFEVAASYGPTFSIVGSKDLFERTFGVQLGQHAQGGLRTAEGELELPLDPLPTDLADSIQAVTFTPPPDFGPTEYR